MLGGDPPRPREPSSPLILDPWLNGWFYPTTFFAKGYTQTHEEPSTNKSSSILLNGRSMGYGWTQTATLGAPGIAGNLGGPSSYTVSSVPTVSLVTMEVVYY